MGRVGGMIKPFGYGALPFMKEMIHSSRLFIVSLRLPYF